jgi:1-acyl-sn-glycerol-3-phosphate acyltransferase
MQYLEIKNNRYHSPPANVSLLSRLIPSLCFYPQFISVVVKAAGKAKRDTYPDEEWASDSMRVLRLLEQAGVTFEITGLDHLQKQETPCVFVGNHMSIMETLVLPIIIVPHMQVTFVVKDSLLNYPIFKHVMRSRNPVAVTRTNPRKDFKTVMSDGVKRIENNISVIVFPQTTRSTDFDPEHFGSIGTKLAKKAGVPIIPMALKTDCWKNGTFSKDLGRICPDVPVKIAFGGPIQIEGKGTTEHQQVVDFIVGKLDEWK